MNDFGFPKQTESQQKGRVGELHVENFVTKELKWIYRPIHRESDFGIDGSVEMVKNNHVTGRTLSVQIKCGDSYVSKKTSGGIKYEGENQHLNYFMNHPTPVILIVLSSDCQEGFWVEFDYKKTNPTLNGWWIEIPNRNRLDSSVLENWARISGPSIDYGEPMETQWLLDKVTNSTDYFAVIFSKEDLLSLNMDFYENIVTRRFKTLETTLDARGKLGIGFSDYDFDPREIYEIDEVRRWFERSIEIGIPWFYLLTTKDGGSSMRIFLFCTCDFQSHSKTDTKTYLQTKPEDRENWLSRNFAILNKFTDENNIPFEINQEISEGVFKCLGW